MENKTSKNHENGNDANRLLAAGWISCENSLPETEGEFLTYNKANDSMTVQYYDKRVWGYFAVVKADVTHWMELPLPPACS